MNLATFFTSSTRFIFFTNLLAVSESFKGQVVSKGQVTLDTFRNFTYSSSYLQTKTFAQSQDFAMLKKLERWPRLSQKALINLVGIYLGHESKVRHWRRPCVFIVNFEHISHLVLVFLLLTLNMKLPAIKSYKVREKELSLNDPYNFQRPNV